MHWFNNSTKWKSDMAHITGIYRIGKDAELRKTQSGESVISLALACNYGRKGQDGKKPTQWLDAALWGKLADALQPYLTKGQQVSIVAEDPHIETFEGSSGPGHKLVARIISIELVGSRTEVAAPKPAPKPVQKPVPPASFDDVDDSIPF
jgi:single-strand DNA-binding protein